jgi:DNA-binding protein H-NS
MNSMPLCRHRDCSPRRRNQLVWKRNFLVDCCSNTTRCLQLMIYCAYNLSKSAHRCQIIWGKKMKPYDLQSMSLDELWSLYEFVSAALARKISAETARLDRRLRQLGQGAVSHNVKKMSHARRHYPQVFPKYRNPAKPSETWAGRGRQPRWLTAQLKSGKQIDNFRIDLATA